MTQCPLWQPLGGGCIHSSVHSDTSRGGCNIFASAWVCFYYPKASVRRNPGSLVWPGLCGWGCCIWRLMLDIWIVRKSDRKRRKRKKDIWRIDLTWFNIDGEWDQKNNASKVCCLWNARKAQLKRRRNSCSWHGPRTTARQKRFVLATRSVTTSSEYTYNSSRSIYIYIYIYIIHC